MTKKLSINNSKISHSNLVVNSPKSSVSNNTKKTSQKKSWQDNIVLYVIIGIVIILIGSYLTTNLFGDNNMRKNDSSPKINVENSTIERSNFVVDSPGAIVGENISVNPIVGLLPPKFEGRYANENLPEGNKFKTEIILNIISQVQLNRLTIEVFTDSVSSVDVRQDGPTSVMFNTQSGSKDGYAFTSFSNAFGSYVITIITEDKEKDLMSKLKISYG